MALVISIFKDGALSLRRLRSVSIQRLNVALNSSANNCLSLDTFFKFSSAVFPTGKFKTTFTEVFIQHSGVFKIERFVRIR